MIVTRYLMREILKPLLSLSAALVSIFAGYSTAVFLAQATGGSLPADAVAELIGLKTVIALEVLLPIALYLAVVIALGRLHSDSEMTALGALGVSPPQVLRAVGTLALVTAALAGTLASIVRPWAYHETYLIQARARAEFDLNQIVPGNFNENGAGSRVIFAARRSDSVLRNVFMQRELNQRIQVLYAMQAHQERDPDYPAPLMHMRDVHLYDLSRDGGTDFSAAVKILRYHMNEPVVKPPGYWHASATMSQLAASRAPADVSEFQWRLALPVSALLLAILGIPVSRLRPRQGRHAKMLTAVLIYAGYYSFENMVRAWVSQGTLPPVPGVWLAPISLSVIAWFAWTRPLDAWRRRRTRHMETVAPS